MARERYSKIHKVGMIASADLLYVGHACRVNQYILQIRQLSIIDSKTVFLLCFLAPQVILPDLHPNRLAIKNLLLSEQGFLSQLVNLEGTWRGYGGAD